MAALGLPILSLALLGDASPWKDLKSAASLFSYFIGGAVISTWIAAFLALGSRRIESVAGDPWLPITKWSGSVASMSVGGNAEVVLDPEDAGAQRAVL